MSVNENDIFSDDIQENGAEDEVASIGSGMEGVDTDKIEIKNKKIIFDRKACIIQTNDDSNALILKVNKQFTRIFGYQKEDVVNM